MKSWQVVARDVQIKRDRNIPGEWLLPDPPADSVANVMNIPYTSGIMTPAELEITEMDCVELLELMATRKLTSFAVTLAFCKRAAIAQQLINCLTDIFFEEGLARAKELDLILEQTGKTVGPYHGLPISLKEHYNLKGHETTCCYVDWVGKPAIEEDEYIVGLLRELGCVFFVKTNTPQMFMHLETNCNVHGRTLNPYNRGLTPGGSSGGESALVGFKGSPIGLGSDGGGSIRCPAAFMGLYGLKATSNRVPIAEATVPMAGCETPVSFGPICRSLRDQELFMKLILGAQPWRIQHELSPLPWRPSEIKSLKVGYFLDDGLCYPHPPIKRAMDELIKKLSLADNITLSEFKPLNHAEGYDVARSLYYKDGGECNKEVMAAAGEPILPMSQWIMKPPQVEKRSIRDSWKLNVRREVYRRKYLEHWTQSGVDVLLCPVAPQTAFRHDQSKCWSYTAIWNALDWPAIAFPTGLHADPAKDRAYTDYKPRDNEFDAWNLSMYEPEKYRGSPIALQLVARSWDDEKVLASLAFIEKKLQA